MANRKEIIQEWINVRKKCNETIECVFYITIPQFTDINKHDTINKVETILKRNFVNFSRVDTVGGAWNLNRDWIESGKMDCIVEYCGVYPINWKIEDVIEFERMETNGEIVVLVNWVNDDQYIPNH